MLMAARKLQGIGLVLLVLILAMTLYPVSLRVASKRSELARVERDIRATRDNIRYLETELGARASMRQLERWNAESFAYSAPTAAQYLDGERQLASLGSFTGARERLAVVAPVQAATAMVAGLETPDGGAVASDSETPAAAILASQIKATAAAADVVSVAKPKMNVVVPSKPTARDRYAERARMIDTLLEKESPVNKTAAAVTKRVETAAAKKAAADKKSVTTPTRTAAAPARATPRPTATPTRTAAATPAAVKKVKASSAPASAAPRRATPARANTQLAAKKPEPKKAESKKAAPRPTAVATKKPDAPKAAAPKATPRKVASADKPKGNNRP